MIFNPNLILSVMLGLVLCFFSIKIFKLVKTCRTKRFIFIFCFILALVSLSIPAAYLADVIGSNPHYSQFRTLPYSEVLVCLIAPLVGIIIVKLGPSARALGFNNLFNALSLVIMLAYISIPYIKPILRPLQTHLNNNWVDHVAIQTTPSTCGPASLATILKFYGKEDSEANIALHSFTSATGTESWYLARYAHNQGFSYQFLHEPSLKEVPTPAIIGVRLGYIGHFITLLSHQNGVYEVADPLTGKARLTIKQFYQKYHYAGFVLYIKKPENFK